ncbi:hypothetical protein B0H13DRAFT_1850072 [Mycena leptocephala]|nr:hypothetical protein B0H13DRAFT_1850072 [Mycena leptocephala]
MCRGDRTHAPPVENYTGICPSNLVRHRALSSVPVQINQWVSTGSLVLPQSFLTLKGAMELLQLERRGGRFILVTVLRLIGGLFQMSPSIGRPVSHSFRQHRGPVCTQPLSAPSSDINPALPQTPAHRIADRGGLCLSYKYSVSIEILFWVSEDEKTVGLVLWVHHMVVVLFAFNIFRSKNIAGPEGSAQGLSEILGFCISSILTRLPPTLSPVPPSPKRSTEPPPEDPEEPQSPKSSKPIETARSKRTGYGLQLVVLTGS